MVGQGYCGICHSCQQDILKQEYQDVIFCDSCKTEWRNSMLKHDKTLAFESMGMPCHACSNGTLLQKYGNIIYCGACGTKWIAYKMRGYSKKQQFKQDLSMMG